ncbi:MAG: VWA domain-containing protein [Lachnospiraceae bacterium]|nr:VWA domain-containing protein [Lachnospiraceae bacterium]
MGLERLWPLAFLIFVPGIVLLYLLKQKVSEKRVPALNLWREAYDTMQANTPWERFRHRLLMYLQILALILLIAGLLMPYLQKRGGDTDRVILCIDCSGSMNGIYDGKRTKLEEAKQQAVKYMNQLKQGTKVTLITGGGSAKILVSDSTDYDKVIRELKKIEPTDMEGDLQAAVGMILPMAKQWKDYQMMGFTDSDVDIKNLEADIVNLSVSGVNAGIVWLEHETEENETVTVQAGIVNYGSEDFTTDIELNLGEELYDVQTVSVKGGESRTVRFREVSGSRFRKLYESGSYFKANMVSEDSLAGDNEAYELLEGAQEKKVLLVTKQNSFLERALSLEDSVRLEKTTGVKNIDPDKSYDFIVYDSVTPEKWYHDENIILVNPPGDVKLDGEVLAEKDKSIKNATLQIPQGTLTEGLENFAVACSNGTTYRLPVWSYSFINYGEDSVGYFGRLGGRIVAVIGFDLHDSDLPLQMEFPIMVQGIIEQGQQAGSLDNSECLPGETVRMRLSQEDEGSVTWKTPSGKEVVSEIRQPGALFTETTQAGLYKVSWKRDGNQQESDFLVRFPESESVLGKDIHVTKNGKKAEEVKNISEIYGKYSLLRPILLALLLLLSVEWVIYRKRL